MLIKKLEIFSYLCILDLIVNGTANIREVNGIDMGELTKYYLGSENCPSSKTIQIEVTNYIICYYKRTTTEKFTVCFREMSTLRIFN